MNATQKKYLERYLATLPPEHKKTPPPVRAGYFCADEKNANICSDLIRRGIKTATCSMKYWYEHEAEPMPVVGLLHVVTDWAGEPTSIIETTFVTECRFCDVTAEHAAAEGEGDRTLAWWREAHWNFFSRESEGTNTQPTEEMLLVLERFKVVYPEP